MLLTSRIDDTTTLVAGARWEVSSYEMGRQEARSRVRGARANAFHLRANDKNLGYCTVSGGARATGSKVVALAAVLADLQVGKAWCGLFEIADSFVVVVADDAGVVLPDGDRVYRDKAEAVRQFESEREIADSAFAPASWGIPDTSSSDELIAGIDWATAPAMQVVGTNNKKPTVVILSLIGVGVTTGVGWQYWKKVQLEREAALAAKAPPPPPQPWVTKARPYAAVLACVGARGRMAHLSRSGWALKDIECDFDKNTFKASLVSYTVLSKLPALSATQTVKLKGDGTGIDVEGALAPARSNARTSENGSIVAVLAARNYIVAATGKIGWQSDGKKNSFSFDMPSNIQSMGMKLETLPTLSFNRIRYDSGQWRVDGEIFN